MRVVALSIGGLFVGESRQVEKERESVLDLDNVKHPGASNDQTKDTNDQRVRVGAATTES